MLALWGIVVGPWSWRLGSVTDGGFDVEVAFNSNPHRWLGNGVIELEKMTWVR